MSAMWQDDWVNGGVRRRLHGSKPVAEMLHPGRCHHCGRIYDAGPVTVVARYTDCSVWIAPCCGRQVDDRPVGWGGGFTPLTTEERRAMGRGR